MNNELGMVVFNWCQAVMDELKNVHSYSDESVDYFIFVYEDLLDDLYKQGYSASAAVEMIMEF